MNVNKYSYGNTPLVSVVIITYNHSRYIAQALESVLNQKTTFQFEIIVADDASPDNTQEIIAQYAEKYPEIITFIARKVNWGGTRNLLDALTHCRGKYLGILDGDDYYTDELKLQKQVDFLESHTEYFSCAHRIEIVDIDGKHIILTMNDIKLNCAMGQRAFNQWETDFLHLNSLIFRRLEDVYRQDELEKIYLSNPLSVHSTLLLLLLSQSPIYVMSDVMSVWRRVVQNDATNYTSYACKHKKDVRLKRLNQFTLQEDFFKYKLPDINFLRRSYCALWDALIISLFPPYTGNVKYICSLVHYITLKKMLMSLFYGLVSKPCSTVFMFCKRIIRKVFIRLKILPQKTMIL